MSFNGPNTTNGIARALSPIMIRHNGDGTSDFYIDGLLSGQHNWNEGWIEILQTSVDSTVSSMEIFDSSGEMFLFGMGEVGSEITELQIPPGGNGMIPIEFVQDRRLVIKCSGIPAINSFMLINFYQPTSLAVTGDRGFPAIFDGDSVKLLKDKFDLAGRAQFIAGDADPRVIGIEATPGSLYFRGDTIDPILYIKRTEDDHEWDIISADDVLTVLGDILDVEIDGIQDGETICFEASTSKWIAAPIAEPIRRPYFLDTAPTIPASGRISVSDFRSLYQEEHHVSSKFQVSSTAKFEPSDLIINELETTDLYDFVYVLPVDTTFFVRVKFFSETLESRWTTYRMVTTRPWFVLKPRVAVNEDIAIRRRICTNTMDWDSSSELEKSTYLFIGDDQGFIDEYRIIIGSDMR